VILYKRFLMGLLQSVLRHLHARAKCASALSLEVGDSEHSAVCQADVLNGDQFPSFIAQVVKVMLDTVHHWLVADLEMV
jgi:hypothetical protein